MMGKLATIWALVVLAIASPAIAQEQIPRSYPNFNPNRAPPDIPRDQRARDEAKANADQRACAAQDWSACADLGEAYQTGKGRPQNRPVAELLYRKACEADVGKGCHGLGNLLNTTYTQPDARLAAEFQIRACRLGWFEGCDAEADALVSGVLGDPDPAAAEALITASCESGGLSSCRKRAQSLMAPDRSSEDQAAGEELLATQCFTTRDVASCEAGARYWERHAPPNETEIAIGYIPENFAAQYLEVACEAGSVLSCRKRGKAALALDREAALAFLDQACALSEDQCADVAEVRDEPELAANCEYGDLQACVALGQILSKAGGLIEDRDRALEAFGNACEGGMAEGCLPAADLVFSAWEAIGPSAAQLAEFYLSASCTADNQTACEMLADELDEGGKFAQNLPQAIALYYPQCDAGRIKACDRLERLTEGDPEAQLFQAHAGFAPEETPEEMQEANAARLALGKTGLEDFCTTTNVVFEGRTYTDTNCVAGGGGLGGFSARRGETPWQALLWRPEVLAGQKLTPAQRVQCGATVIRRGWVLTAAHCLTDNGVSISAGHRIRMGLSNPMAEEGSSYAIKRVIPHPDYDRTTLAFDIALVEYDPLSNRGGGRQFSVSSLRLDPQPLTQRQIEAIPRVFTYGWGITQLRDGMPPDHLRGFRLKLRDARNCTTVTQFTDPKRINSVLCADDAKGTQGGQACFGDSGGPLITFGDSDGLPSLIGVVSGGVQCGTVGKPSRYVRVAHPRVQAWLKANLPQPRSR